MVQSALFLTEKFIIFRNFRINSSIRGTGFQQGVTPRPYCMAKKGLRYVVKLFKKLRIMFAGNKSWRYNSGAGIKRVNWS
jgi:hypothetical protein